MAGSPNDIRSRIDSCMTECIKSKSIPRQSVTELQEYFYSHSAEFSQSIAQILYEILPMFQKHPSVEKYLNVIIRIFDETVKQACSSESQDERNLTVKNILPTLELLVLGLKAKDNPVRTGCTWMIHKFLCTYIHRLLDFPPAIFEEVKKTLKVLIKDKISKIRNLAIKIAKKFDLNEIIFDISTTDPNKENRVDAIRLAEGLEYVQLISKKIFDYEPDVRIAALEKILNWELKYVDLIIKREILFMALRDRSAKAKKAALDIINKEVAGNGIQEFVKSIEVHTLEIKQQREFCRSLRVIVDQMEISDLKEVLSDLIIKILEPENEMFEIILARIVIESLMKTSPDTVYSLVPSKAIIGLIDFEHPVFPYFFTQNILKICLCLDVGDEDIRKTLISTLTRLCFSYKLTITPQTIDRAYYLMLSQDYFADSPIEVYQEYPQALGDLLEQNDNEYCRIMTEIINEIRDPLNAIQEDDQTIVVFIEDTQRQPSLLEKKLGLSKKLASIDQEIDAFEDERERLIESGEYGQALKLQEEVMAKVKEAERYELKITNIEEVIKEKLYRALILTTEMLRRIKHGVMHLDILELVTSIINPSFDISEENLHIFALECLGQCCLHKIEVCYRYIYLFKRVLDSGDNNLIEFTALKSLLDIQMVWDLTRLDKDNEHKMEVSNDTVFWIIIKSSNSPDPLIRGLAIEGISKLMLLGKIDSPIAMVSLMVPYFDSNSSTIIKQTLQVFFPSYSILSKKNSNTICEGFKLVLELFIYTSSNPTIPSPYSFNTKKIFQFICTCLSSDYIRIHGNFELDFNYHLDMFYFISKKILLNISETHNEIYSKMLTFISIQVFSDKEIALCKSLMNKITREIKNKFLTGIVETIEKRNLGYLSFEDIEDRLIDRWHQTTALIKKFLEKVAENNHSYITPAKNQDSAYKHKTSSKRPSTYKLGSDAKRFKK
jgi:Nuclear condensing complex subunits, C-term domain